MEKGSGVELRKSLIYLWTYAMNQDQAYSQTAKQRKIVDMMIKIISHHRFAAKGNDKGFIAMCMDIG
jgi:hypothetical protein